MELIDLHVHSNASDGSLSPSELADLAIESGLSAIALTDHDTIDGIYEIMDYTKDKDLEIIPGIEISCYYRKREIHILGFFIDYENESLKQELDTLKAARHNRNLQIIERMRNDGIDITMEKLLHGNPNSVITRAHFARVLVEEGVCKTKDMVFKKYLGVGCKYYIPKKQFDCESAMRLLSQYAKGIYLAHPLLYNLGYSEIEDLIEYLKPLGLDGIEAYHSSNNAYESDRLRSIALKHDIGISGGSDFHGAVKPDIRIGFGRGNMNIQKRILDDIKSRICS